METNYNTTVLPTNLMLVLDNKLQSILFNLIQLSNAFADGNGYFYRSNSDLQKAFGCSKPLVIAAVETLYRHGLISVKSIGFQAGKRRTNYYRVNFEKFNQWDGLSLLQLYNLPSGKRIKILNYSSKDFKVTYTNSEKAPTVAPNEAVLTTIHVRDKNATDGLKTTLNDTPKVATTVVSRNYVSESERIAKIRTNSNILLEKLKQLRKWSEYQEKIKLYEDWLKNCCSTLTNGDSLKRELYNSALHIMDEITFEDDKPRVVPTKDEFDTNVLPFDVEDDDEDWDDSKDERLKFGITENQKTKLYRYCGNDKEEMITIGDAIDNGYNLRLLYDVDKHIFYCPPSV